MQVVGKESQVMTQEQDVFEFMARGPSFPQIQSKLGSALTSGTLRN